MKVFKFKDDIDNNYAFVLAKDEKQAIEHLKKFTSIPFSLVSDKKPSELKKPFIVLNNILPF